MGKLINRIQVWCLLISGLPGSPSVLKPCLVNMISQDTHITIRNISGVQRNCNITNITMIKQIDRYSMANGETS